MAGNNASRLASCFAVLTLACGPGLRQSGPPALKLMTTSFPTLVAQRPVHLAVAALGQPPITFAVTGLPEGLSSSGAGVITGAPSSAGDYLVHLHVAGQGSATVDDDIPMHVISPPVAAAMPVQNLVIGAPVNETIQVSGGTPPYHWIVKNGPPRGITFKAGVFGGAATETGATDFLVTIIDSLGASVDEGVQFRVDAPLAFISPPPPVGNVGYLYTSALQTSGGRAPVVLQLRTGALPPGIQLVNSAELDGTPSTVGRFDFTMEAVDALGRSLQLPTSILIVANPPLSTKDSWVPAGVVGQPYSATFVATNGPPPYVWSAAALPPGLSLSADGVLSGTPTDTGEAPFLFAVTDANGQTATLTANDFIKPPLHVDPHDPIAIQVGDPFPYSITAGDRADWTRISLSGIAPPGMAYQSSYVLGTSTTVGAYLLWISAGDFARVPARHVELPLPFAVLDPAQFVSTSLSDARVGVPYQERLQGHGGLPPYTFSVSSGTLPPGLSLAADGTLHGTPTQTGEYSWSAQMTDARSRGPVSLVTMDVLAAIAVSPGTVSSFVVGVPAQESLSATGGTQPYSWALVSGTMPPGLSLTSDGSLAGTPSAAGSYTFTVRATDAAAHVRGRTLTAVVADPLAFPGETLEDASVGWPYGHPLQVTGGTAPMTFRVVSGALPDGLALGSDGMIHGAPTASGSAAFTVAVTDVLGQSASASLAITVTPQVVFNPVALPQATYGQTYSAQFTATGGSGGFQFHVTSGTLPSGLTLTPDGALSGTPSSYNVQPFEIGATDSLGATAWRSFYLPVESP